MKNVGRKGSRNKRAAEPMVRSKSCCSPSSRGKKKKEEGEDEALMERGRWKADGRGVRRVSE